MIYFRGGEGPVRNGVALDQLPSGLGRAALSPLASILCGLRLLCLPLSLEPLKRAFKQLSRLVPRLQVARQVYLVQFPSEFVFFGVWPNNSDSVLQCVNDSHAAFRAARDRFLEDEQKMSQRVSRAGVIAECRVENDFPGFLIHE